MVVAFITPWHVECSRQAHEDADEGQGKMFEMLVGGFLLTGSVCAMDGSAYRDCREIPVAQFGNKYVCDKRAETIRESFPALDPERLGFDKGELLKIQVTCTAAHMARI